MAQTNIGLRGTNDFVADSRPKNWNELLLALYPNGDQNGALAAMVARLKKKRTDDPEYNWWEKRLQDRVADITGVYTDALSTAYSTDDAVKGDSLWFKMSEEHSKHFTVNHIALITTDGVATNTHFGRVTAVTQNGANSFVKVTLMENDDNGSGLTAPLYINDADKIMVHSSSYYEGSVGGTPVTYSPTKIYNYTQIFRAPLKMTRTALRTRLRTKDDYKQAKMEALMYLKMEINNAFWDGIPTEETNATSGEIERTTGGIVDFIRTNAPNNYKDFKIVHSGSTWLAKGEEFFDDNLEVALREGGNIRVAFAGSGAVWGLSKLVKSLGNYEIKAGEAQYGIKIMKLITPQGELPIIVDAQWSHNPLYRNRLAVIDLRDLVYRYIDDIFFKPGSITENRNNLEDAISEEFICEVGLEMHHAEKMFVMDNVGVNAN